MERKDQGASSRKTRQTCSGRRRAARADVVGKRKEEEGR